LEGIKSRQIANVTQNGCHLDSSIEITTSGQRILIKGRITILSPLLETNGFVRPWFRIIPGSLASHESAPKQHLNQFNLVAHLTYLSAAYHAVPFTAYIIHNETFPLTMP